MKYPKIQTIWKRDENNKYVIMEGDYSKKEFEVINRWHVTEKIDGTNIRVFFNTNPVFPEEISIRFGGRTDRAQIPTFLIDFLQHKFTKESFIQAFNKDGELPQKVILFGEGYGGKIQKVGKKYKETTSFILFDVWIDGWWLKPDLERGVQDIASIMSCELIPKIAIMTTQEAINYIKSEPQSIIAKEELIMEGIVCRSEPLMLFRNGNPIMWKLKVDDYRKLKRFGVGGSQI